MSLLAATSVPEKAHVSPPHTPQPLILQGISWETYESLLADLIDSHAAHFTFDQGVLEIMVLSAQHEKPNRTLSMLVEVIAEETGVDIERFGSTTFKRADLHKGFEPDSCFYIQNEERVRGKLEIDLLADPPPDLVIEIDISHPSLNKLPIYAQVGIPEVWRYTNNALQIFALKEGYYEDTAQSVAFPLLTNTVVVQFLEESVELRSTAWLRRIREWVRSQTRDSDQ